MPSRPFAIVLGTAQDGGYPHVGCDCAACSRAVTDPSLARRVACLGLVLREGTALVDATPDLPAQLRALAAAAGRPVSEPPRAILLTHLHAGHVAGLLALGREGWAGSRIELWATESCLGCLERNEPFARLFSEGHLLPRVLHLGWDVALDELMIQPILVPHRNELGDTVAYRIDGGERSLFYAPDLDALTSDVLGHVRACDTALLDGTFFRRTELSRDDANLVRHPAIADTMAQASPGDTRIVFTHLNHTNPVLDPSSRERAAVQAVGMRVAHEGDTFDLA